MVPEARKVGLEPRPRGIVVGDHVQTADSIDDAVHPGDKDGHESGHGAKQEGWRRRMRNDL
jgi:hypothetical protein